MMKCHLCAQPATFHVTQIDEDGDAEEVHFCEEHFHAYMKQDSGTLGEPADAAETLQALAELADEPAMKKGAGKRCPHCGISFHEFREKGRFGCPADYDVFREQLLPLIENIHDATAHSGKVPPAAGGGDGRRFRLIRLRRDLAEAVEREDYEAAAQLRDEIEAAEG